jgi:hypothetical protein
MFFIVNKANCLVDTLKTYEQNPCVEPITEDHVLSVLLEDFSHMLPGNSLPAEGRRLWYALLGSSKTRSKDATMFAAELADWIVAKYVTTDRLIIDLSTCSLMLDGQRFTDFEPLALTILKYLQDNPGRPVTSKEMKQKIPGCKGHERRISRILEKLEKQLNHSCEETKHRGQGQLVRSKTPPIQLIKSKPGAGRWLSLPEIFQPR